MIELSKQELFNLNCEMIEFTKKCFDYFNGRINVINKYIQLEIDPSDKNLKSNLDLTVYGLENEDVNQLIEGGNCKIDRIEMRIPATIKNRLVYTDLTIEDYDLFKHITKIIIIHDMVHELYHADHNDNIYEYATRTDYATKVERQVEYMTYKYIRDNKDDISINLDIKINDEDIEYILNHNYIGRDERYYRVDLFDYYNKLLNTILAEQNSFSNDLYMYNNIAIGHVINDEVVSVVYIKEDGIFDSDFTEINNILQQIYYQMQIKLVGIMYRYSEELDAFVIYLACESIVENPILINPIRFIKE